MTPGQVKLVQQSFAKVAPIADKAADLFYDRLFTIAPEVRSAAAGMLLKTTVAVSERDRTSAPRLRCAPSP
jgi:hypothetical protein